MLPEYELPDVTAQHPGSTGSEGGAPNLHLERIGRYAQEHGMYRVDELYDDDRDHFGD
jgi:hypothetical protein